MDYLFHYLPEITIGIAVLGLTMAIFPFLRRKFGGIAIVFIILVVPFFLVTLILINAFLWGRGFIQNIDEFGFLGPKTIWVLDRWTGARSSQKFALRFIDLDTNEIILRKNGNNYLRPTLISVNPDIWGAIYPNTIWTISMEGIRFKSFSYSELSDIDMFPEIKSTIVKAEMSKGYAGVSVWDKEGNFYQVDPFHKKLYKDKVELPTPYNYSGLFLDEEILVQKEGEDFHLYHKSGTKLMSQPLINSKLIGYSKPNRVGYVLAYETKEWKEFLVHCVDHTGKIKWTIKERELLNGRTDMEFKNLFVYKNELILLTSGAYLFRIQPESGKINRFIRI